MKTFFACLLFIFSITTVGQSVEESNLNNSRYFEDQFYLGISYNVLANKPSGVSRGNLSLGFQGGFIKDIPINYSRKLALGLGLGYSFNFYNSNLRAVEGNVVSYEVLQDASLYRRNSLNIHSIELPFEIRWRNSTPEEYKFFRIYTGFKLGYVFRGNSSYVTEDVREVFKNVDLNKIQYGLTFSLGYSMLNMHVYYGLNGIFKDNVLVDAEAIIMKPLRIGFIFYIL